MDEQQKNEQRTTEQEADIMKKKKTPSPSFSRPKIFYKQQRQTK